MMTRLNLDPAIVLDVRRAAWFPRERVLAVADLHLGYAWAHRLSGQLMPITPANDTLARLQELQRDYEPREIVVLGDIVHRAMALPALEEELRELFNVLSPRSQLTFLAGNHDRELQQMMKHWLLPIELAAAREVGTNLFLHGDAANAVAHTAAASPRLKSAARPRVIIGHEHPAISIGDGVTTSQKCPCFLVSERVIVLPAFSRWAAGTDIRCHPLMSPFARAAKFTRAIAICGDKLLPIAL
jgi:putative SbcD/Mre11-related phosphoesterase